MQYIFMIKKWKKATEKDLVKIFNKFQNLILKESIKWENTLSHDQNLVVEV